MKPSHPITYITRDIERAIGTEPSDNYFIIANKTPYAEGIAAAHPDNVLLIESPTILGTRELIEHTTTKTWLASTFAPSALPFTLVFKNTARVEEAATKHSLKLINPSAALSETIENKMSQIEWLGDMGKKYLPRHSVMIAKKLTWTGEPFIVQWAHGHTGGGTLLISNETELRTIQEKFPFRMTRRSAYIKGPSFTVNAVVAADKILVGNISYQITGLRPFTDNPFSTVGNDWSATHTMLTESEIEYIETMASDIGKKLNISGWRGLYGIDVIKDVEHNTIYLIEINARQPASTSFESSLQRRNRDQGADGITTFEAHLSALLGEAISKPLIPINDGAQIVQRVTKATTTVGDDKITALHAAGYQTATYPNTDLNEDLVRIQSTQGIIDARGELNERGQAINNIFS